LEQEIIRYREQMQKMKAGPAQNQLKQRALFCLKQKKMYEQQRDQLMQQQFNMEQAQFASETMQYTVTQMQAMKNANVTMRQQLSNIPLDEIDDVYDDMQDLLDQNNEIQELLSRSYDLPFDVDEEDLEQELQSLEGELESEEADIIPSYLAAMSPPNNVPTTATARPATVNTNTSQSADALQLPQAPNN
jgi:charged multivesicular body protein 5